MVNKCFNCGKKLDKKISRLCRQCYYRRKRTPTKELFFRHVNKTKTCWIWTACKNRQGYGSVTNPSGKPKMIGAHRLSWILHKGPIPKGLDICHHCDNPPCIRPSHLFQGTAKENMKDMILKGRKKPFRMFSDEQVKTMRHLYYKEKKLCREIADRFKTNQHTIYGIIAYRNYRHIL